MICQLPESPLYTEGICGDGAAILRDGVMVPIGEVVWLLNQGAVNGHRTQSEADLAELLGRMRTFAIDHEPHGWPAIQMRDITALCDAIVGINTRLRLSREALEVTLGNIRSLKGSCRCITFDPWMEMVSAALPQEERHG